MIPTDPSAKNLNLAMDRTECAIFLKNFSFATLVVGEELAVAHVPFLFDADLQWAYSHLARSNPILEKLNESSNHNCLISVMGPHAYVSTDYYLGRPVVPTWNYATVSIWGQICLQPAEKLFTNMTQLLKKYQPDLLDNKQKLPDAHQAKLMQHIVGIEVKIERIAGRQKLGQSKPLAEQQSVLRHLSAGRHAERAYVEYALSRLPTIF